MSSLQASSTENILNHGSLQGLRSFKQPLNPDFVYNFPAMVLPTDFDPDATPSTAAQSDVQLPATTPTVTGAATKKKSAKSAQIHDQLELEGLKQRNLQLELKLLLQKEKLGVGALRTTQDKMSADAHGQLLHNKSQETILVLLLNEVTPPSREDQNQLANPTFPVMQQLKASAKGHTVFSAKGTLDYNKLAISEFVFAFLEFVQQQHQSQHQHLLQFLQLLMKKAINYSWPSVQI